MKDHCRFIAIAGVILCIIGTLYNAYQVQDSPLMVLLMLVMGGIITYMMYIP